LDEGATQKLNAKQLKRLFTIGQADLGNGADKLPVFSS